MYKCDKCSKDMSVGYGIKSDNPFLKLWYCEECNMKYGDTDPTGKKVHLPIRGWIENTKDASSGTSRSVLGGTESIKGKVGFKTAHIPEDSEDI